MTPRVISPQGMVVVKGMLASYRLLLSHNVPHTLYYYIIKKKEKEIK